jgi:hypothetical protein
VDSLATPGNNYKTDQIDADIPAGDRDVVTTVVLVVTRFGLRNPVLLLATYLDYRRAVRQAMTAQGLLRSAFVIESLTSCYSLSIWDSRESIPRFGTIAEEHVNAARRVMGRVKKETGRGPEVWSTKWLLTTVSNNLKWDDFDLASLLEPRWVRGQET